MEPCCTNASDGGYGASRFSEWIHASSSCRSLAPNARISHKHENRGYEPRQGASEAACTTSPAATELCSARLQPVIQLLGPQGTAHPFSIRWPDLLVGRPPAYENSCAGHPGPQHAPRPKQQAEFPPELLPICLPVLLKRPIAHCSASDLLRPMCPMRREKARWETCEYVWSACKYLRNITHGYERRHTCRILGGHRSLVPMRRVQCIHTYVSHECAQRQKHLLVFHCTHCRTCITSHVDRVAHTLTVRNAHACRRG